MQRFLICSLILGAIGLVAQPKKTWPVQLKGAERVVYKTVGDTQLHLHIFRPPKQRTKAPAVVSTSTSARPRSGADAARSASAPGLDDLGILTDVVLDERDRARRGHELEARGVAVHRGARPR